MNKQREYFYVDGTVLIIINAIQDNEVFIYLYLNTALANIW